MLEFSMEFRNALLNYEFTEDMNNGMQNIALEYNLSLDDVKYFFLTLCYKYEFFTEDMIFDEFNNYVTLEKIRKQEKEGVVERVYGFNDDVKFTLTAKGKTIYKNDVDWILNINKY